MLNPTPDAVELKPGGIDVAIRYGRGHWPGLAVELLLPTTYVLVGAPSLIGDRAIVEPADILDLPWLQELGTSEMSAWLRKRGVVAPKTENIVHLPGHLVLEGLRNGEGVSLTTTVVVERELASGALEVLFEDPRARRRLLHRHPPGRPAPAAQGLRQLAPPPRPAAVSRQPASAGRGPSGAARPRSSRSIRCARTLRAAAPCSRGSTPA